MTLTLQKPTASNVTIKLEASQRERLKLLAAAKKRTSHYLMKEAIERYIQAEEAQQSILKSVDDSIQHFEKTGLHISLDDVKSWSNELKINRNAQLPACHQ